MEVSGRDHREKASEIDQAERLGAIFIVSMLTREMNPSPYGYFLLYQY